MKINLFYKPIILLLFFISISCKADEKRLQQQINVLKAELPISIGTLGEFSDIDYDGINIIYKISVNENVCNLDYLNNNKSLMRNNAVMMLRGREEGVNSISKLIGNTDAGLSIIYIGKDSGKEARITLSKSEIKKAMETADQYDPESVLAQQVAASQSMLPQKIDEVTTVERMYVQGDSFFYIYSIDENKTDMEVIEYNKSEMRKDLQLVLKTNGAPLARLCKEANKNIIYRYKGSISGKSIDFKFSPNEL